MMPLELINHILLFSDVQTMIHVYCGVRHVCDHLFWLTKFNKFYILNYDMNKKSFIEWIKLYHRVDKAHQEAKNLLSIIRASNMTINLHYQNQFHRFIPIELQKSSKIDQYNIAGKSMSNIHYDTKWRMLVHFTQNNIEYSLTITPYHHSMILSIIAEVILNHKQYNYDITDIDGKSLLYEKICQKSKYWIAYQVLNFKS